MKWSDGRIGFNRALLWINVYWNNLETSKIIEENLTEKSLELFGLAEKRNVKVLKLAYWIF